MKGPHDDELTWPLRESFEIKLLNQIRDNEHHSMTLLYHYGTPDDYARRVTDGKGGWGFPQYISNESLNRIDPLYQYSKDDCLFFQVTKL